MEVRSVTVHGPWQSVAVCGTASNLFSVSSGSLVTATTNDLQAIRIAYHGSSWPPMEAHGVPLQSMVAHASPWQSMVVRGSPWEPMTAHGRPQQSRTEHVSCRCSSLSNNV